jgi:hypothetical protein
MRLFTIRFAGALRPSCVSALINSRHNLPMWPVAQSIKPSADYSPSPGGEGRGEGGRQTDFLSSDIPQSSILNPQSAGGNSYSLRSSKLKALKGRPILAQGKCESASAPPWVRRPKNKPLTVKPRDSANLICGILSLLRHGSLAQYTRRMSNGGLP